MSTACSGLRQELVECIRASDCFTVEKKKFKDCLQRENDGSVPPSCRALQTAFFECKRGMLDMRNRMRGNKGY